MSDNEVVASDVLSRFLFNSRPSGKLRVKDSNQRLDIGFCKSPVFKRAWATQIEGPVKFNFCLSLDRSGLEHLEPIRDLVMGDFSIDQF